MTGILTMFRHKPHDVKGPVLGKVPTPNDETAASAKYARQLKSDPYALMQRLNGHRKSQSIHSFFYWHTSYKDTRERNAVVTGLAALKILRSDEEAVKAEAVATLIDIYGLEGALDLLKRKYIAVKDAKNRQKEAGHLMLQIGRLCREMGKTKRTEADRIKDWSRRSEVAAKYGEAEQHFVDAYDAYKAAADHYLSASLISNQDAALSCASSVMDIILTVRGKRQGMESVLRTPQKS
jgi:hypothetical protein